VSSIVNTNISAMRSMHGLRRSVEEVAKTSTQLASGTRINKAADDAAGLGSAEKMDMRLRSSRQALRNAQDAVSLFRTVEGALDEIANIYKRKRELAMQSASETLSDEARLLARSEYDTLGEEVDRIIATSITAPLADRGVTDSGMITTVVGDGSGSDSLVSFDLLDLQFDVDLISLQGVVTADDAKADLENIDLLLEMTGNARSVLGAWENRLTAITNNLGTYTENVTAAHSRVRDADFGEVTARLARAQLLQQAGVSVLAQANALPANVIRLIE
jgi:flagellin